ncbi:MAG: hypothetical protein MUF49_00930 [Oculatellaceae cyanobacterium Prado106]|nr:hypothetical protein [Oculatellaceae cyanobacterium Prado106]
MSTPKLVKAAQTLLQQISRMARTLTQSMMSWLLRNLLRIGKPPRFGEAGFVLPTVVLLLLVVTLTVGTAPKPN